MESISTSPLASSTRSLMRARIRAASAAAFFALSTPTQATGTPGGICTIERSASSPSRTLLDERSGTPMTGRSVCAAATPGSAAASPAPAMITRTPLSRAPRQYSATASGVRCAERTSSSCAIPRDSSSSSAGCIRSMSDSDPTRIPTTASANVRPLLDLPCDVRTVPRPFEMNPLDAGVGALARLGDRVGRCR